MTQKVCPVVYRLVDGRIELLAFEHPSAGKQFIKGSIQDGELARDAAVRELREESGIALASLPSDLGNARIRGTIWHFYAVELRELPERWDHQTEDDEGHIFAFFWHALCEDLDEGWYPMFHDAILILRRSLLL